MTAARNVRRRAGGIVGAASLLVALSASAQTGASPSNNSSAVHFGQPGTPVDITADRQDVFQNEQRIVYDGRVEVVQGTSRLRAVKLTIWYNNKNAVRGPVGAPPVSSGMGAVEHMEADGPVYFVTPTQSAKGDHGSYLAADDAITLTGNVVLTQDKNVSTGDKLVIHQKTGLATLSSEKASGRVRGVFYNEDKTKPAANGQPAPAPAR